MKQFHVFDWSILGLYIIGLIWVGVYKQNKKPVSQNEFILSGRKLSLGGFIATLVTTWYGAILGIGENTFLYGIQTWFIFSLPYYLFAMAYAFWIAPKINQMNLVSIPDHFRNHFGNNSGIISALLITFLASPAPYILSMGILLQFLFGLELGISLIITSLLSVTYIWNGGFSAVVKTDIIQFIFMFLGFFIIFGFLCFEIGTPNEMLTQLPKQYLEPFGGNTAQYVLAWFFIAAWTFIDPGFFQRCAASDSPETARKGILISISFWAVFDCLTIISGLYAVNLINTDQPLLAFPLLGALILPVGFLGLFITGLIAIIMSTIDSLSLVSAITLGRDILWRIKRTDQNSDPVPLIKKGLVIISFLSVLLAFSLPSVVKLFYTIGSILIPGLILPFIVTLLKTRPTFNDHTAVKWILSPVIVSLLWFVKSYIDGNPFLGIEPFYPGIIISIIYYLIASKKNQYGD